MIPAKVGKPRDKPNCEESVKIISIWIIAALRNQRFFSLAELNDANGKKLAAYNSQPFQGKEGNRLSIFLEEKKPFLLPLPAAPWFPFSRTVVPTYRSGGNRPDYSVSIIKG